jgi:hypothetical protein
MALRTDGDDIGLPLLAFLEDFSRDKPSAKRLLDSLGPGAAALRRLLQDRIAMRAVLFDKPRHSLARATRIYVQMGNGNYVNEPDDGRRLERELRQHSLGCLRTRGSIDCQKDFHGVDRC